MVEYCSIADMIKTVTEINKAYFMAAENKHDNHLDFVLLLGFCWAGGAAPPRAPASFAAGRSLAPVSPAGCSDAGVFLSQNVQVRPERT